MRAEELSKLETVLIYDEGMKLSPYKDTLGNWTIAVGYFIGKNLEDFCISEKVARVMLYQKINESIEIAIRIFGEQFIDSLTCARKAAILSLIFNMGEGDEFHGFRSFKKTIEAIKRHDWDMVCENLEVSKWARQVDPKQVSGKGRDDRIIYMFKTGEYSKEYGIKT